METIEDHTGEVSIMSETAFGDIIDVSGWTHCIT